MAGDMMNGKYDLSNLANIEHMSEELMSKISPEEMNNLANNIDGLMPALSSLVKSSMPSGQTDS